MQWRAWMVKTSGSPDHKESKCNTPFDVQWGLTPTKISKWEVLKIASTSRWRLQPRIKSFSNFKSCIINLVHLPPSLSLSQLPFRDSRSILVTSCIKPITWLVDNGDFRPRKYKNKLRISTRFRNRNKRDNPKRKHPKQFVIKYVNNYNIAIIHQIIRMIIKQEKLIKTNDTDYEWHLLVKTVTSIRRIKE